MWGHKEKPSMKKPALEPPGPPDAATDPAPDPPEIPPGDPVAGAERSGADPEPGTRIGAGSRIKGTVSGDSDVYVDGEIEGTITLPENALIVGLNGRVQARVKVRSLTLCGHLEGKVRVTEKIEIRQFGSLIGDLVTARIVVEDGAALRGSVDILKPKESERIPPPKSPPATRPEHSG